MLVYQRGRPADVYLAVIALSEKATPFYSSILSLVLIHCPPCWFSYTLKDNGGAASQQGGFTALTFSGAAGSRLRSEMKELHL